MSTWYVGDPNAAWISSTASCQAVAPGTTAPLNAAIQDNANNPPPTADKNLIYFLSDGAPTSGHALDADVVYGGQTGQAAWEQFVGDKADIAFCDRRWQRPLAR